MPSKSDDLSTASATLRGIDLAVGLPGEHKKMIFVAGVTAAKSFQKICATATAGGKKKRRESPIQEVSQEKKSRSGSA